MIRHLTIAVGLSISLNLAATSAQAQWGYPMGYGRYGMSRWGQDPAAGYMAGLGSFARGQGAYQLDKAKADAINVETMVKWNRALRARQASLQEERQKEARQKDEALARRVAQLELRDGTTLNALLSQVLDIDPTASKSGRANAPISSSAIREIPFEWNSEAVSACLDQMTGKDSLPLPLMAPKYVDEREALHAAVAPALDEDVRGTVSRESIKKINEAIARFRTKFLGSSADFESGYDDALSYFNTMASLSRLLNDPSMKTFLAKLENNEERTVGDLVSFMNSHNLRFGPAMSDRQVEIYTRLVPVLTAIRDQVKTGDYTPTPPDRTGEGLRAAAKQAFKPMTWEQLEAHARDQ
jgi:hypothetical protein